MISMHALLEEMNQKGASDLHITAGVPPVFRVDGQIVPTDHEMVTPEIAESLIYSVLREDQRKRFEQTKELDLSFGVKGLSRFRVNVFLQRGVVRRPIRMIPYEIPTCDKLGLPHGRAGASPIMPKGLVLVTGPTGSGKSTTLAALIDRINERAALPHHHHRGPDRVRPPAQAQSIVNQREVNADTRLVRGGAQVRPAPGPRRDPDR